MITLPPQQGASFADAPAAMITLPPRQGAFADVHAAAAAPKSGHRAPAGAAEAAATLQATSTPETTETATTQTAAAATAAAAPTATADVSAVLDAQAKSEAVSSTLMGIALLAYLQGSAAKHEASGTGAGGCGSSAAPSSSHHGGPAAAAARPVAAAAHPHERLPPRRYQRMSPVDTETPTEPLTRMLAAIQASQSKAQYTCKRYMEKRRKGERKRKRERERR